MFRKVFLAFVFAVAIGSIVAESAVKDLDDNNFDEVVNDKNKDVFVMFHATWCGHCKRLMPTWEKLGDQNFGPDVIIARVDASTSTTVGKKYNIRKYPTVKYFTKNNKEGIEYVGDRTMEDLTSFVQTKK